MSVLAIRRVESLPVTAAAVTAAKCAAADNDARPLLPARELRLIPVSITSAVRSVWLCWGRLSRFSGYLAADAVECKTLRQLRIASPCAGVRSGHRLMRLAKIGCGYWRQKGGTEDARGPTDIRINNQFGTSISKQSFLYSHSVACVANRSQ
jgi:hypothetical protein